MLKPLFLSVSFISIVLLSCTVTQKKKSLPVKDNTATKLNSELDSVSYGMGVYLGNNLKHQNFGKINSTLLAEGLNDAQQDSVHPLLDMKTANEIITNYLMKKRKGEADRNLNEGKQFLAKNKTLPGVITLPSGLQYKILKQGSGEKPGLNDTVTVNYTGSLINGKVFDSSIERGEPLKISLNHVIEGWQQALVLMPVGSKWKLFIPSELAYGNSQAGSVIGPNSVLIFEVELLSIDKDKPGSLSQKKSESVNIEESK